MQERRFFRAIAGAIERNRAPLQVGTETDFLVQAAKGSNSIEVIARWRHGAGLSSWDDRVGSYGPHFHEVVLMTTTVMGRVVSFSSTIAEGFAGARENEYLLDRGGYNDSKTREAAKDKAREIAQRFPGRVVASATAYYTRTVTVLDFGVSSENGSESKSQDQGPQKELVPSPIQTQE